MSSDSSTPLETFGRRTGQSGPPHEQSTQSPNQPTCGPTRSTPASSGAPPAAMVPRPSSRFPWPSTTALAQGLTAPQDSSSKRSSTTSVTPPISVTPPVNAKRHMVDSLGPPSFKSPRLENRFSSSGDALSSCTFFPTPRMLQPKATVQDVQPKSTESETQRSSTHGAPAAPELKIEDPPTQTVGQRPTRIVGQQPMPRAVREQATRAVDQQAMGSVGQQAPGAVGQQATGNVSCPPSRIIIFDQDGDLRLKVGNEMPELLVDSRTLCRSSEIFRRMLSSGSVNAKPAAGQWQVELGADFHRAFVILMDMLHGQYIRTPNDPSLQDTYALLVLIKKYGASQGLRPVSNKWVTKWAHDIEPPDNDKAERLMFVAWEMGHAVLFKRLSTWMSKNFTVDNRGDLLDAAGKPLQDTPFLLQCKTLDWIKFNRTARIGIILDECQSLVKSLMQGDDSGRTYYCSPRLKRNQPEVPIGKHAPKPNYDPIKDKALVLRPHGASFPQIRVKELSVATLVDRVASSAAVTTGSTNQGSWSFGFGKHVVTLEKDRKDALCGGIFDVSPLFSIFLTPLFHALPSRYNIYNAQQTSSKPFTTLPLEIKTRQYLYLAIMAAHYSDKKDIFPLSGGCVCGLIRFQLALPPLLVHCCSCTACQRQTGTVLALNALIESSALTLLPPAPPVIPGSPTPTPATLHPAFAQSTRAEPATVNQPPPEPRRVCVPTESGIGQSIAVCPACGTALWNHYADAGPHISYVRVGTLDRAWEVEPDVHIFTRSRAGFLDIDDGKPQFKGYYPDRMALLREEAKTRVEALEPVIKAWKAELRAAM
ncbi:hypothetical protein G7046_g1360 [Stylonectria norvegica]|nr:hypothetical protein G7046_g1360 [Stylonectria norvegica]